MPRITSGSTGENEGFSVPFKVIGAIGLIACAIAYVVYQYVQLNPSPQRNNARAARPAAREDKKLAAFAKLDLTDDQKKKLETLATGTTNPAVLRRQANQILTSEQKAKAKNLRAAAQAARLAKQQEQKERQEKLYQGNDRKYAETANKQIKEREAARRKAAEAGSSPKSSQ